ncbi:MAG: GntR family transcriptional regulator [Acidobacteria bacterium]|nr:GntR family transcriptional regulator [Acidobacteriota bacterium]
MKNMMKARVLQHIKPISKKDQVIEMIKGAMLSGKMEPGEPIVENRVAHDLGVGTPLVREALIELEHQGFVQKFPYKGTYVTKFSPHDIENIFNLRIELESIALQWAKKNATPDDIEALRNLAHGMREGADEMKLDRFYENDIAFHRKLWEISGNPYLVDTLERLVVPLFAFFLMRNDRDRENYLESAHDHLHFIESLPALDGAELRKVINESMSRWKDEMLSRLFPEKRALA